MNWIREKWEKIRQDKLVLAIRANKFMIPVFVGVVVVSVTTAWWINSALAELTLSFPSVPIEYIWWTLGVLAVIALIAIIVWVTSRRTSRTTGTPTPQVRTTSGGGAWWPVSLAVAFVIALYGYNEIMKPTVIVTAPNDAKTLVFREGAPATVLQPPKTHLDWWGDPSTLTRTVGWSHLDGKFEIEFAVPKDFEGEMSVKYTISLCTAKRPC